MHCSNNLLCDLVFGGRLLSVMVQRLFVRYGIEYKNVMVTTAAEIVIGRLDNDSNKNMKEMGRIEIRENRAGEKSCRTNIHTDRQNWIHKGITTAIVFVQPKNTYRQPDVHRIDMLAMTECSSSLSIPLSFCPSLSAFTGLSASVSVSIYLSVRPFVCLCVCSTCTHTVEQSVFPFCSVILEWFLESLQKEIIRTDNKMTVEKTMNLLYKHIHTHTNTSTQVYSYTLARSLARMFARTLGTHTSTQTKTQKCRFIL